MREIREVYQKYAKEVFRFSLYLSGSFSDAEDITSETFVRILTNSNVIVGNTVKAYLFVVAKNIYLERLKKSKREQQLFQTKNELSSSIEQQYEKNESLKRLLNILSSMSVDDRSAVLMRQEGMSYKEISICLGISVNTAKVKVHRVRQAIKKWRTGENNE